MAGDDWSREEVEATVGDYFAMLRDELAGLPINKADHNERLRRLLRNRSKGSVEFKHANISAVLTLHGYPYIDGYKPRLNFQALLEQVVLEFEVLPSRSDAVSGVRSPFSITLVPIPGTQILQSRTVEHTA